MVKSCCNTKLRIGRSWSFILVIAAIIFSITSIEAQSVSVKQHAADKSIECEEGRRTVDNAFYETREDTDAKLIFILNKGDGETDSTLKDRARSISDFCEKRGFAEKCITAIAMPKKGLGSARFFVVGKLYATFFFRKNHKSFCEKTNWDIY